MDVAVASTFVVRFLSDAWIDALAEAAAAAPVKAEKDLVVQQVVHDGDAEVTYAITVGTEGVRVSHGRVPHADVTFSQDRATAAAIARGELSARTAFLDGRLRMGGRLDEVAKRAASLADLDDLFESVRERTEW